ncbi:MAG: hypothetical protein J5736_04700 [Bacilli bacterium]|nr:hypothetical protein [Bacilli bacterium]
MEEQLPTRTPQEYGSSQQFVVEEEEKGITLASLWRMIVKHWKGIALFTLAGIIGAAVYAFAFKKPVYTSTGTAIVLVKNSSNPTGNENEGYTSTDYTYSMQLANTCAKHVMQSDAVYTAIAEDVNAEGKYGKYSALSISKIVTAEANSTTSSLTSSPVVTVKASTSNSDFSKFLVDSMLKNGVEYASTDVNYKALFGENGVKIVNYATEATDTSMSKLLIMFIGLAGGLVLGAAYAIIFDLADTHVVSSKSIEDETGVKVIGIIPDISAAYGERKQKKGRRHHAA